jgi:ribonuclease HI
VVVSWKKLCRPYEEGGLGIRSLIKLNEASNLKNCSNLINSDEDWAIALRSRTIRDGNIINHHIFSSLWSSVKSEHSFIMENSLSLIGDGTSINFWTDKWGGPALCDILQIPTQVQPFLQARVSDFIRNFQWCIPWQLQTLFPNLKQLVEQVTIPKDVKPDKLVWTDSTSGDLTLKDAYLLKANQLQGTHWAKSIWCRDIPPSKSLIAWRIMHDKMPTDEKLMERGLSIPSMCNLCYNNSESSFHIFFDCPYAIKIWIWLSSTLNLSLHFNDIEDIWRLCDRSSSAQCKIVIKAAVINILSTLWYVRNQARFNNNKIHWKSAINQISSSVTLTGNNTNFTSTSSMTDFQILKKFSIRIHPPIAPQIKEIIWQPPLPGWIKANSDGSASSIASACGVVFRNCYSDCMLSVAENIGISDAFQAELCGAMRAIEIAHQKNWLNLWLETDSKLVVLAFSNEAIIPWNLSNRWFNCKRLLSTMHFVISHIYREGNQCADSLANIGLSLHGLFVWETVPTCISSFVVKEKLGMPSFRFVSF